jgi:Carboxypeptidase regulatory-like domain
MRRLLTALAAAGALPWLAPAAIIRGMVVENQTGHPLARTLVVASPVAGTSGGAKSARTDLYGSFVFEDLPAGAFLVSAARKGFASVQYGQKQWKSAGLPVILEENQRMQIEIRLPRLGAIAGRVVDENDVGMPDHDVVVYRIAKPPVLVSRATSDDRGIYRVGSLEPGSYVVRTVARMYEEGGYLPTFYRDVSTIDQAHPLEVMLDQQVEDIAVRPTPGRLFKFAGIATVPQMRETVITMTLVSDMGKETTIAETPSGKFQFNPQAPGKYELNLHAVAGGFQYYGYQELEIDRDLTDVHISGTQAPLLRTLLEDSRGGRVDFRQMQMMARRKELSGPDERQKINLTADTVRLPPGRWEFALDPSPALYASGFQTNGNPVLGRADGWNEDMIVSGIAVNTVKFVLSNSPGSVHGSVMLGTQQALGAPVFLESSEMEPARRFKEPYMVRTDTRGQYQFSGLAPGQYRLLATFEYQSPTAAEFDMAHAVAIKIEEARDLQKDLDLFVAR